MKRAILLFLSVVMIFTATACKNKKHSEEQTKELYNAVMEYKNSLSKSQVKINRTISMSLNGEDIYNNIESYTIIEDFSSGYSFSAVSSADKFVNSWYYSDGVADLYIDGAGYTVAMSDDEAKAYSKKLGFSEIDPNAFENVTSEDTSDGYMVIFSGCADVDNAKQYLEAVSVTGIELVLDEFKATFDLDADKHPVKESIHLKGKYKVAGEELVFDVTIDRAYSADASSPALPVEDAEYIEIDSLEELYLFNNSFYNLTFSNFAAKNELSIAISQDNTKDPLSNTNGDIYNEKVSYVQNVSASDFQFVNKIEYSSGKDTGSTPSTSEIFYQDGVLTTVSKGNSTKDDSNSPYKMLFMVTSIYGAYADTYDAMNDFEKTEEEDGNIVYKYNVSDENAIARGADIAYMLYGGSSRYTLLNALSTTINANEFLLVIDPDTKTVVRQSFRLDVTYNIESTVIRVSGVYNFDMEQYENGITVVITE